MEHSGSKRAGQPAEDSVKGSAEEPVEIRPVESHHEFQACVELQERVWGTGFSQCVPSAILKVTQRLGGVVSGAWRRDGTMVGFVFGMTGWEDGVPVHWSDMLAVDPDFRDGGLGRRLKLHQRDELLGRGVTRMYWTFDPLESRNAHLNLERLGAVGREYVRDMYGASDSPLHRGIGTDRFLAVWEMDSPRVRDRVAPPSGSRGVSPPDREGAETPPPVVVLDARPEEGGERAEGPVLPGDPELHRDGSVLAVAIPGSIQALLARHPEAAELWRERTRATLEHYLGRGWVAAGLRRRGTISQLLLIREEGVWDRVDGGSGG